MVASIGAVAAPSQGASYYERDGYYAQDSPDHRQASAWAGRGAAELGLDGPVDPDTFRAVLEGRVPDGSGKRLGRVGKDRGTPGSGEFQHRPGRDLTFSAPKSVSLAALVGGDARVIDAHDRAVGRALDWFEKNAAETRMKDPETGRMARTGHQKAVIATFRHDASRNLDPALHTHSVIANMVRGEDGKWRSMANERLYASKMLLGALYRNELAGELAKLGYGIEKTHADGRFEIAGVPRAVIDAYSTRRAEIEAAMAERGMGGTAENQRLAQRAALFTRAAKRDVDRVALRESWLEQAADLGFDAGGLVAEAGARQAGLDAARETGRQESGGRAAVEVAGDGGVSAGTPGREDRAAMPPETPAARAARWAVAHLSEREAVFSRTDLLAAALAFSPGAAPAGGIEREVAALEKTGTLHAARLPGMDGLLTTDRALADERETVALMEGRTGARRRPDARARRRQGAQGRAPHPRAEGGREAHPVREGPDGGCPGLCGQRQDHHAAARPRAHGEEGLPGPGACALGLRSPHARSRGRDRERDAPALPHALRRRRRGAHDEERRARHARGVREDRAGGRRGLARLHRPDPRPAQDRGCAPHPPGGAGGRCQTARRGRCRQALRPAPDRRHEDRRHGRDHATARSRPEASRRGEPSGRDRPGLREAGLQYRRGEARQPRGRRRRALARAVPGSAREHRADGAEPLLARADQRDRARATGPRRRGARAGHERRTSGLPGVFQCGEDAGSQLRPRRHGGVPPPLQEARRRQGRRASRPRRRPQGPQGDAPGERRPGGLLGPPTGSRRAPAGSRSIAPRKSSSAPETASAGPATTWGSGW